MRVTNPTAQVAMEKLSMLKGCQAHSTTILSGNDEQVFNRLGIDITSDPNTLQKAFTITIK